MECRTDTVREEGSSPLAGEWGNGILPRLGRGYGGSTPPSPIEVKIIPDIVPSEVQCPWEGHDTEWLMRWDGSRADYLCCLCQKFFDYQLQES